MDTVIVNEQDTVLVNTSTAQSLGSLLVVNEQDVVLVSNDTTQVIVTGLLGPRGLDGIQNLSQAQDIDKTELINGATLVYRSSDSMWKATNKLDNQILEAGQF